jgi:2-dehydro-3-deoxyphosphogluconate aldolase / (4S)-4-hydroxy-2-oxoglutarate aldolase
MWTSLLAQYRAIAVIRAPNFDLGLEMARSVSAGGIRLIEVTWDSAEPTRLIETLRTELPGCIIGTGTILTLDQLQDAIACGAQFAFSPYCNPAVIEAANLVGIPIIPGALTPTEILTAWQAGADSIKVFPISAMGNASYIKSLRDPLKGIPLIPTGGVTIENAPELIQAGAIGVGISTGLFPVDWVRDRAWDKIRDRAQQLQAALAQVQSPG